MHVALERLSAGLVVSEDQVSKFKHFFSYPNVVEGFQLLDIPSFLNGCLPAAFFQEIKLKQKLRVIGLFIYVSHPS